MLQEAMPMVGTATPGWKTEAAGECGQRGPRLLLSVLILNYNYGRYLKQCIQSVLDQEYEPMEIIVVDDGSTDNSRLVINSFEDRIAASFKPNGGMVSAMNHAYRLSHGSIVIFLDADDYLLPGAAAAHVEALERAGAVRSQTCMTIVKEAEPSDRTIPFAPPADGDLRDLLLERGPGAYVSSPNSGNAWRRSFLEKVFPLPEEVRAIGAETFLMDAAPLFGKIVTLDRPEAAYRVHEGNMSGKIREFSLRNMLRILAQYRIRMAYLAQTATSLGYAVSKRKWETGNWRLLTLQYLAGRLSEDSKTPSLAEHLKSALRVRGNILKRMFVALVVFTIRCAPVKQSLRIANRVIALEYM
jgi:glycosyltransferase involved in cell wall biosynthesis